MSDANDIAGLYPAARKVLLDAIEALGSHQSALILVGAQAVYLRVGETDLAVAPYTSDGDLAIDPARLNEIPPLQIALSGAGFRPKSNDSVGIWVTTRRVATHEVDIPVDLLVPMVASANPKSRAAELTGHARKVARNVEGLDGALVDNDAMTIRSLEETDSRSFDISVAGPAALLIAKLHKISDRIRDGRLSDKDALDVLRLLRGTQTPELARRFQTILADEKARESGQRGLQLVGTVFIDKGAPGPGMLRRAVGQLADPEEMVESARVLLQDLVGAVTTD